MMYERPGDKWLYYFFNKIIDSSVERFVVISN